MSILPPLDPHQPFTPIPWEYQVRALYGTVPRHQRERNRRTNMLQPCISCGQPHRDGEPAAWVNGCMTYRCAACHAKEGWNE